MTDRNPAIRRRTCRFNLLLRAATLAGLSVIACLSFSVGAGAQTKYLIREPIYQMLVMTRDSRGLCHRPGGATNHLVLFMPTPTTTVPVYWHRATDLFIQYPGTSGCIIWKRR